jgi:lysophospholipase L1-like esterase
MNIVTTDQIAEVPRLNASVVAIGHVARRLVLVGLIAALATYSWIQPGDEPASFDRYLKQLAAAQQQGGPQYTAMVGDSITAGAQLPLVCGKPVVKAAFNGARVAELVDHVVPALRANPPSAVLLAAGVNDTWRHLQGLKSERMDEFRASYRALIDAARALTPHVGIVLIPPVAARGDLGADFFDTALISEFNAMIGELAAEARLPVVSLMALAGPDGLARAGLTLDGVHPSAAGYSIWTAAVAQAWTQIKRCE